jgi:hypothetical protein
MPDLLRDELLIIMDKNVLFNPEYIEPLREEFKKFDFLNNHKLWVVGNVEHLSSSIDEHNRVRDILLNIMPGDFSAYEHTRWGIALSNHDGSHVSTLPNPGLLWTAMLEANVLPGDTVVVYSDKIPRNAVHFSGRNQNLSCLDLTEFIMGFHGINSIKEG